MAPVYCLLLLSFQGRLSLRFVVLTLVKALTFALARLRQNQAAPPHLNCSQWRLLAAAAAAATTAVA